VSTVEAPQRGLPPTDGGPGFFQKYGVPLVFLAPTLVLLGVWIVYPTIRTIIRSFYDREGDSFVGLDNYETLFTDDTLVTAIKNNFLWLLIVPGFVTAIGLVFAVLLERIRFSTAFKVAVFMPMAISLFAAGVIWRLMYEKDPDQGTVNAAIAVVKDALTLMKDVVGESDLMAGGKDGALQTEMPDSVAKVLSEKPEAAMVVLGDFAPGQIETKLQPETGYNVFTFPSIEGSKPSVVGGGDLFVKFKDSPAADAFLEYLTTTEAAEVWAKRGGFSSPNKNLDEGVYPDEITRTVASALPEAETFRFDLSDLQPAAFGGTPGQGLFKAFTDFVANPDNIDQITAKMEADAKKAFQ